ncbi:peptidylprolyl isomerase [Actinoplanes friuliensis]|uniref:Cyclophilin type peptidyl-prolyl cis-trans isomerase n=1 Tax=Actinoplanes friuliensis DSM 7358 TaxID=1246995 RepID=U5W8Z2_9ACTN|nr:peptidylprolyl isomerase [Actinoplanes friuliensis]AGZ44465.1 cyclophilin type peptidyl-prolyl cis-trans isomerase [Actinoplanes friuliensis DSM 7358]
MASSRDRARKLAREKLDRQQARRAGQQRRRRQIQAGLGAALALVLIVAGVAWLGGAFDNDEPVDTTATDQCAWTPQNAESNPDLKDVGEPPTSGLPTEGTRPMTITTDQGEPIVVSLDLEQAPCSAADLTYLASKKFYDNTTCHEITTEGAIRCGDPSGTGQGGPAYSLYNENTPLAPTPSASASPSPAAPLYPRGTVALIGNPPGANGSQFLIFFKDFTPKTEPQYPIVGTVTGGLATVTKLGKIATVANTAGDKVTPKDKITIKSLTVGEPGAAPAAVPSASSQS